MEVGASGSVVFLLSSKSSCVVFGQVPSLLRYMPTLLATTTAFLDWARQFCVYSRTYNADGMARSSGEKTAAPIIVHMFNKEGQNTGARAYRNRCNRDIAKATAARPKTTEQKREDTRQQ